MRFRETLGRGATLVIGIAYGAGMMYLLDPQAGRRRRAMVRDQIFSAGNDFRFFLDRQARYALHNLQGKFAEIRARSSEGQIDDDRLVARVRAQIGHVVSHPGSLDVGCSDGHVTISGPILRDERAHLEKRLSETRGVRNWTLHLREQESAGAVPGLQGESRFQRQQRVG